MKLILTITTFIKINREQPIFLTLKYVQANIHHQTRSNHVQDTFSFVSPQSYKHIYLNILESNLFSYKQTKS